MKMPSVQDVLLSQAQRDTFWTRHQFIQEPLLDIKARLNEWTDPDEQNVLDSIEEKWTAGRKTILCCGVFSAGKSTFINRLIGEDHLPSHPIPTSANVVHFEKGEPGITLVHEEERPDTVFTNLRDWDTSWFQQGADVKEVYLQDENTKLPTSVELIDTPGIDSTVEAHQLAAESRLPEADIVCYVMDYQQVESEENIAFLSKLNHMDIRPLLIVNQADKHNENQGTIGAFRERMEASFQKRGIRYEEVYFISSRYPEQTPDEWDRLMKYLFSTAVPVSVQVSQTAAKSIYRVMAAAAEQKEKQQYPAKDIERELGRYTELKALHEEQEQAAQKKKDMEEWQDTLEKRIFATVDLIFTNAKLTPYHTRNAARDYLESRQPAYRIKGLFGKNKTRRSREERLEALKNSLTENARNYIDIPLREQMTNLLASYRVEDQDLQRRLLDMTCTIDDELIRQAERSGASFTQGYVLSFSRWLTEEIKRVYKQQLIHLLPKMKTLLAAEQKKEAERLEARFVHTAELLEEAEAWQKRQKQWVAIVEEWMDAFREAAVPFEAAESLTSDAYQIEAGNVKAPLTFPIREWYEQHGRNRQTQPPREEAPHELRQAASLMKEFKALETAAASLESKAERLEQAAYRVALFGAFSSGKTTFANALIGDPLLPVSSHPTTAFVTTIRPAAEEKHGTVSVVYKTEARVVEEMNELLFQTSTSIASMDEWASLKADRSQKLIEQQEKKEKEKDDKESKKEEWIDPLRLLDEEEKNRLDEYEASFRNYEDRQGERMEMKLEAFQQLTGNAEEAMMIDRADVDAAGVFTSKGYTLTDTPGVHSIYKRHTLLAFEEMKKADAIFFATYYNHAFSRADVMFLTQLGRLTQYFSYNKIFFLVNAADLAEDAAELDSVIQYVKRELESFGLENPPVYPVSSLQAGGESRPVSGMDDFMDAFEQFSYEQLQGIVLEEGRGEIRQAVRTLDNIIDTAALDASRQQEKKQERLASLSEVENELEAYSFALELDMMQREMEELLFYVKQRVFYRYYDLFKDYFTPYAFQKERSFSDQLKRQTNGLVQEVFLEFDKELQATGYRMEQYMKERSRRMADTFAEQIPESMWSAFHWKRPAFDSFASTSEPQLEQMAFSFFSRYTSYSAFFMDQQIKPFKDELEEELRPPADELLEKEWERMRLHFTGQWETWWADFASSWQQSIQTSRRMEEDADITFTIEDVVQARDELQRRFG